MSYETYPPVIFVPPELPEVLKSLAKEVFDESHDLGLRRCCANRKVEPSLNLLIKERISLKNA